MAQGKTIRIRQVRSGICCPEKQKKVLRGLGFKRLQQVVEHPDNPGIRGMVFAVKHLVEILPPHDAQERRAMGTPEGGRP